MARESAPKSSTYLAECNSVLSRLQCPFKRSEVKILACIRGFPSEIRLRRFVFGVEMPWGSLGAGKKLISVHTHIDPGRYFFSPSA